MKLPRRRFLQLAAGAAALPIVPRTGLAQSYPARAVRIIVPVAPGGALDITARLIGQWLSERLGQSFLIENRPGASTNIGIEAVAHAAPDGYTLLLIPASVTVNATLFEKLNFNFIRDIAPVASISRVPLVMEVNLAVPAKTVPEFITYAKANAGKVTMASGGTGSTSHVGGELFKIMTGIDMLHVPYRGGAPALTDLLGGQVQVMFSPLPESLATIKAGKVRALAMTTATRSDALPEVPPVAEFRAGLRGQHLAGHRRAQRHAGRDHRPAQPGDQRRARRSRHQGTSRRPRQHPGADDARRVRADDRGRDREVGQGGAVGQYQAGVGLTPAAARETGPAGCAGECGRPRPTALAAPARPRTPAPGGGPTSRAWRARRGTTCSGSPA